MYTGPVTTTAMHRVRDDGATEPDDDLLAARALAGDRAAFGTLVERYMRSVYRLALRMLANPTDAEDAAQEAFVRAYVRLGSYQPGSNFKAWLLAIAAHWCIDQRRRRRTVPLDTIPANDPAIPTVDEPETQFLRAERQHEVRHRLAALPEHYQKVLILRYWHGLSYAEVARTLGQPTSTVRMRLFRAHRRLGRGA